MSILITGCNGFIGKNIMYENFNDKKICVGGRQAVDFSCPQQTKYVMDNCKPKRIIHLAGTATIKPNANNPTEILDNNIKATYNICHYAPQDCYIQFASSITVYGSTLHQPDEYSEPHPSSIYAITKLASENIIRYFCDIGKIKATVYRLCAIVGPKMTHGMMYDFFKKAKQDGENFDVLGAYPGAIKPFCHIDDVIKLFKIVDNKQQFDIINVCSDDSLSVLEVAETFLKELNVNKKINFLGSSSVWKGDNNTLSANNSKFKQKIFTKTVSAKEAIIKCIKDNK